MSIAESDNMILITEDGNKTISTINLPESH